MPAVLADARHHSPRAKPTGTTSPDAITIGRLHLLLIVGLAASASGFGSLPAHTPTPTPPRVPCSTPVTVTVTVKDTWCKTSHPHDFMGNIGGDGPINGPFTPPTVKAGAHTSPTVVYTHGASATPAWGEYATQGGAKVLKVCLVSGAAACSPGAALCCPALLGWTLQAPGCLTIRGLPHPGVADIATTGNPAVFIADMTSHFLTHLLRAALWARAEPLPLGVP